MPHKSPPIVPPADDTIADDFTREQIAEHLASTLQCIVHAEAEWPGLVSLVESDRTGNLGKLIALLDPSLQGLFEALTPVAGEAPAKLAAKTKLAAVFNATLGNQDQGKDPGVFEVELLVRRITRIKAAQQIVAALDVARGIADSNAEFRSLLAPVTNSLGEMTKAARTAQADARVKAKAAKVAGKANAAPEAPTPAKP